MNQTLSICSWETFNLYLSSPRGMYIGGLAQVSDWLSIFFSADEEQPQSAHSHTR